MPSSFSWERDGAAYQVFSALCDQVDWMRITSRVASGIAKARRGESIRVLDVGAGLGGTAASIRRSLLAAHDVPSTWHLVEPDPVARQMHALLCPSIGAAMRVSTQSSLPDSGAFDAALMIHSAYYIDDLGETLSTIRGRLLRPSCPIVIVTMATDSAFFVSGLENRHRWTSQEVNALGKTLGFDVSIERLHSRFRWPVVLQEDDDLKRTIAQFVTGRARCSDDEVALVAGAFRNGADFADNLIILRGR